MDANQLRTHAERLLELLSPACQRIEIAGSLRRQKPGEIKDIEIVCIAKPTTHTDLLGDPIPNAPTPLDDLLAKLLTQGGIHENAANPKNGSKYKTFVFGCAAVDLFIASSDNFGNQLAIRTGSAIFSRWFMTARLHGGAMPYGLRQVDGYLWRKIGGEDEHYPNGYERIPCPEESDYFAAIGIPILDPRERNEDGIRKLGGRIPRCV